QRDDVIGSPYCVRRYVVDDSFGGPLALAEARAKLAARGVRLLLDYVPNHVAPDHPWVTTHPELLVNGGEADIEAEPAAWARAAAASTRRPCSSPRPTGIWNGHFSSRASTSATTSGSMTGSSAGTWPACAVTCTPIWPTSRGSSASWRTTTSLASRVCSPATPNGPRRWPSRPSRARPCGTRDSSRAGECARRSSCRAGPANRPTPPWPAGTGGCWTPWPAAG